MPISQSQDKGRLDGKVAVVTGGVSGIGRGVVDRLLEAGAKVGVLDFNAEAVAAFAAEIGSNHIEPLTADVTDEGAVASAMDKVMDRFGRLDIVVNSAGNAIDRHFLETSVSDFRRIVDINLAGSFIVAQQGARRMLASGGDQTDGRIVLIGSVSGVRGNTGRSAYGASKGGVHHLARVLALDLGPMGILTNVVAPGPVDTALTRRVHPPAIRRQWNEMVPQGRYGSIDEIAGAVLFLVGPDGSYMNGHVLCVDGGFSAAGLRPAAD